MRPRRACEAQSTGAMLWAGMAATQTSRSGAVAAPSHRNCVPTCGATDSRAPHPRAAGPSTMPAAWHSWYPGGLGYGPLDGLSGFRLGTCLAAALAGLEGRAAAAFGHVQQAAFRKGRPAMCEGSLAPDLQLRARPLLESVAGPRQKRSPQGRRRSGQRRHMHTSLQSPSSRAQHGAGPPKSQRAHRPGCPAAPSRLLWVRVLVHHGPRADWGRHCCAHPPGAGLGTGEHPEGTTHHHGSHPTSQPLLLLALPTVPAPLLESTGMGWACAVFLRAMRETPLVDTAAPAPPWNMMHQGEPISPSPTPECEGILHAAVPTL